MAVVAGLALLSPLGCLDPTQIQLDVYSNAVCADVGGTSIAAGLPGELDDGAPQVASTTSCTPSPRGAEIGSLVLVPSDADDAVVGIRVALSLGGAVEACLEEPYAADCIIARRSLRFIPQTPLTLPVRMSLDCRGVFCDELTTCVNGTCVDASIDGLDCLEPAGCEPEGGGGAGGEGGAPPLCGEIVSGEWGVGTGDGKQLGAVAVAADPESCTWGVAWVSDSEVCLRAVDGQGDIVAEPPCQEHSDSFVDVAVAPFGGGAFAAAGFSPLGPVVWLTATEPVDTPPLYPVFGVDGGALSYQDGQLVLVTDAANGPLELRTYTGGLLDDVAVTPIAGTTGFGSDLTWSGSDLVVGWNDGEGLRVARFPHASGGAGASHELIEPSGAGVALANGPNDVVALLARNADDTEALHTVAVDGTVTLGDNGNVTPANVMTVRLTGTASGWVMSFVANGNGSLVGYGADGQRVTDALEVAPGARYLDVAAIGDQLAVAWTNQTYEARLRLLDADLSELQ